MFWCLVNNLLVAILDQVNLSFTWPTRPRPGGVQLARVKGPAIFRQVRSCAQGHDPRATLYSVIIVFVRSATAFVNKNVRFRFVYG